jgi:hypothetical protein
LGLATLGLVLLLAFGQSAKAQQAAPPELQPDKVLQQMCDYLKSLPQFSFQAEVTDDRVYLGGKKLQFSHDLSVLVRRPDRLRVNWEGVVEGKPEIKQFFFDGQTMTLYDKNQNVYGAIDAPGTLDAALAKANQDFGLRVSLADLAATNLYDLITKNVKNSLYIGRNQVRRIVCQHLAFDKDKVHLQFWIEAGDKPLLRKIVITQKTLPGSPQWTAYLSDWNVSPQLQDDLFHFEPPQGAQKIKFMPPQPPAAPQKGAKAKKKGGKS